MHAARAPISLLLCCAGVIAQEQTAIPAAKSEFTIETVEGNGAINSIRLHRGHDPVVRLMDADGKPIAGATVTFLLPATGASGSFGDGGQSLTVPTGEDGTATGRGLRPNAIAGQFQIRVVASWRGTPESATLSETNVEPDLHAGRSKKIAIAVVIAGAAIGGVVAAASHKSSSNSGSTSPGTTTSTAPGSISSGTPTIGPPH